MDADKLKEGRTVIKVETITIRRFGKSLYFKVPDIFRTEEDPQPGDKVAVYRDVRDLRLYGLKMEGKTDETTVTFLE